MANSINDALANYTKTGQDGNYALKSNLLNMKLIYHAYSSDTLHVDSGHTCNSIFFGTQGGYQFVMFSTWFSNTHLFKVIAGNPSYTVTNNNGNGYDIQMNSGEYYILKLSY